MLLSLAFMALAALMFFSLALFPDHTASAPPPGVLENIMIWGFVVFGWAAWLLSVVEKGAPSWTAFWIAVAVSAISWASIVLGLKRLWLRNQKKGPNPASHGTLASSRP